MADAPISAQSMTIQGLFLGRRFGITYYQREYSWSRGDVKALLSDLHERFVEQWDQTHDRAQVGQYEPYFLGSIVYYEDRGTTYVIDGQQRITTLHLLLIHMRRLLVEQGLAGDAAYVEKLIRPDRGGQVFAIDIPEHRYIYEALIQGTPVRLRPDARPSEGHLLARSKDLDEDFPVDLTGEALGHFVDWLLERVCIAGIRASGRDHGWQIFETTNDRGVRLGPIDLLKGHLLAKAEVGQARLNDVWREMLSRLSATDSRGPSDFVKAYLLAKHVRVTHDDDRRQAAEAFHEWVRLNAERMGLNHRDDYARLIRDEFAVLGNRFSKLNWAARHWDVQWAGVFFNEHNQVPHHLAVILAACDAKDSEGEFTSKAILAASFLDLLYVRRLVNSTIIDARGLEGEVLGLIQRLRDCHELEAVRKLLAEETVAVGDDFKRLLTFGLTPSNRHQVRYVLARLTAYAEVAVGRRNRFPDYVSGDAPHEIEHIWGDDFERYRTETSGRRANFDAWRNRLGGLLLLPSHVRIPSNTVHQRKLEIYKTQHILAASLHPATHVGDADFRNWIKRAGLDRLIRQVPNSFGKDALDLRQEAYKRLCELVWDPASLNLALPEAPPGTARVGKPKSTQRRGGRRTASLAQLVEAGILADQDTLVGQRRGIEYAAKVQADGGVLVPTGEFFPNPDAAGAFVLNNKTCRGWDFWHVVRRGGNISLKDIRTEAVNAGLVT